MDVLDKILDKIKLNQKGLGIFAIMGIGLLGFLVLPIVLFTISEISLRMYQAILAFLIIAYVRGFGIEGPLMWILSGILIYFLVWKYVYLTSMFHILIIMMGLGFTSAIIWGSASVKAKFLSK
jgi:hypothetical protein